MQAISMHHHQEMYFLILIRVCWADLNIPSIYREIKITIFLGGFGSISINQDYIFILWSISPVEFKLIKNFPDLKFSTGISLSSSILVVVLIYRLCLSFFVRVSLMSLFFQCTLWFTIMVKSLFFLLSSLSLSLTHTLMKGKRVKPSAWGS